MKVLLTGATGFLGNHILEELIKQEYNIVILKRSFSDDRKIKKFSSGYSSYDIDKTNIYDVFNRENKFDIIIHSATCYGRKNEKVIDVFQSNVVFPLQLLEVSTLFHTDLFINIDTSFNKLSMVKGYMQNYLLTKQQFRDWGKLFAEAGKINFINLLLEHFYGEGDDNSKFTSYIINSCLKNVEKIDLTDGEQLRDFIYIDDVVSAIQTIINNKDKLLLFNEFEVGSGKAVKVKDFVNLTKLITNSTTQLNYGALPYRENEITFSQADISKIAKLGWIPKYNIENGITTYMNRLLKISNS